ncbi:MAG: cation:proton antiporter family protein [Verrucomicrobiota bacterium]
MEVASLGVYSATHFSVLSMDALFLAIAFACGLLVRQVGLPPLVGFLGAGFVLHALGQTGGVTLDEIADLGVKLMLFAIGLKLRIRSLLRPEIWGGTSIHSSIVVVVFGLLFFGASHLGLQTLAGFDFATSFLLSFALSFSSTVFAIKILEENGEMGSLHGRATVGILIMQDLIAVVFLTLSLGKIPSLWAIPLVIGLIAARPLIGLLVSRSGHGEMTTLCGLFLALVLGAYAFEWVGLKGDLGALFIGILIGQHPKAKEISKSLVSITDLFLVGFFLSIGLKGLPSWDGLVASVILLLLIPFKSALFFFILTRFNLRSRTSWMGSLHLSTYSEFGLIVIAVGSAKGWISEEWLVNLAIAVSLSFLAAAPFNRRAESAYRLLHERLLRFETAGHHPDDLPVNTEHERIAIFGMGRMGLSVYTYLNNQFPGRVIGFDMDPVQVATHQNLNRNVVLADATDSDFWEKVKIDQDIELVVLAMPKHAANLHAADVLKETGYEGVVTTTAKFDDEVRELRELGVDSAFNFYNEAGAGFSRHVSSVLKQQRPDLLMELRQAPREENG